jgi:hypothetical protein
MPLKQKEKEKGRKEYEKKENLCAGHGSDRDGRHSGFRMQ